MALENTTAQYVIELTTTGGGAETAVSGLRLVRAEAAATSAALKTMSGTTTGLNSGLRALSTEARAARESFRAMSEATLLLGGPHMQQATMGVMGATSALRAMRAIGAAAGLSLAELGPITASVAAVVWTGVEAWKAHAAAMEETRSAARALAQEKALDTAISARIEKLREEGRLFNFEAEALKKQLDPVLQSVTGSSAGVTGLYTLRPRRPIIDQLVQKTPTEEDEKGLAELKRLEEDLQLTQTKGYEKEMAEADALYAKRVNQIYDLGNQVQHQFLKPNQLNEDLEKAQREHAAAIQAINAGQFDKKAEADERASEEFNREMEKQKAEAARQTMEEIAAFDRQLTIDELSSGRTRIEQARDEYQQKVAFYEQLLEAKKISQAEMVKGDQEAQIKELQAEQSNEKQEEHADDKLAGELASGISKGIEAAITGREKFGDAMKQMFAGILADEARDMMKDLLSPLIKEMKLALKGLGGAAGGTVRFAADGLAGLTSGPVYLPRYNTIAGEAGTEMLSVLARPRFMSFGGVDAVVGDAGNRRLAMADANQLAAARQPTEVHVRLEPGLRGEIVGEAVQHSVVRVTHEMGRHGNLSKVTRSVTRS